MNILNKSLILRGGNMCKCDVCTFKVNSRIVVPDCCQWYTCNVMLGEKSADDCPHFKPAEDNIKD